LGSCSTVAADLRHGGEHDDLGVVQPQMAAAQRGDLACAQAGVSGEAHHQVVGLEHAVSQRRDLVGGQEVHLLVGHRRQLDTDARVLADRAEFDGQVERLLEPAHGLAHLRRRDAVAEHVGDEPAHPPLVDRTDWRLPQPRQHVVAQRVS
jgi:hypothetical protein